MVALGEKQPLRDLYGKRNKDNMSNLLPRVKLHIAQKKDDTGLLRVGDLISGEVQKPWAFKTAAN